MLLILELGEHGSELLLILRKSNHRLILRYRLTLLLRRLRCILGMLLLRRLLVLVDGVGVISFHVIFLHLLLLLQGQAHLDTMLLLGLLVRARVELLGHGLQFEILLGCGLVVEVLGLRNLLLRRLLVWRVQLHLSELFVVLLNLVRILI